MDWIRTPETIGPDDRAAVGGKAAALAHLAAAGGDVPPFVAVPAGVYRDFVERTGLRQRIALEFHRKDFDEMRWEEIWDSATRIRNLFVRTAWPPDMADGLRTALAERFGRRPVAVRSSAPEEDADAGSFAGLHASYLNVRGGEAVLDHLRRVWASLWSDAALLYRRELRLDPLTSAMAVVVQDTVVGRCAGVCFSRGPVDVEVVLIEAVHGLNQGLVDGAVAPDRWQVERVGGAVRAHQPPECREAWVQAEADGVRLVPLPESLRHVPPLAPEEVGQVAALARRLERLFEAPQDVEWTFREGTLYLLQARPITTLAGPGDDRRGWYLSLHRSLDNLLALRRRIETELLPAMAREADAFAAEDLRALDDDGLADAIAYRSARSEHWSQVYWDEFIPFAHGFRLFGQYYNDVMRPEDPHEFVALLTREEMLSLARNRRLAEMAALVRRDPAQRRRLAEEGTAGAEGTLAAALADFERRFGDLTCTLAGPGRCAAEERLLVDLLLKMADHPPQPPRSVAGGRRERLEAAFLDRVDASRRDDAAALLDLARASYRLRDDDNLYLGRIEAGFVASLGEGRRRIAAEGARTGTSRLAETVARIGSAPSPAGEMPSRPPNVTARQLVGQPAGPGLARGPARIVRTAADLAAFAAGDVLVCDAVDPNMTFIVPLAAAVVERRGGMLIHGAIIAREYGLPCVTGIADATGRIRDGDRLTVDGYLGIVTVGPTAVDQESVST